MEYRNNNHHHHLGIPTSFDMPPDPRIQQQQHTSMDKELMRMAMLKHEEIFREQVYELHRLYRIQKLLMKDGPTAAAAAACRTRGQTTSTRSMTRKQQQQDAEIKWMPNHVHIKRDEQEINGDGELLRVPPPQPAADILDESEIQLTLGPSIYSNTTEPTRTPTKRNQRQRSPPSSRHSLSASSNSTTGSRSGSGSGSGSGTSQIHHDQSQTTMMMMMGREDLTWGDFIRPSSSTLENKQQMATMMMNPIGVGEDHQHMGQDRLNPSWLFQPLSLKLT